MPATYPTPQTQLLSTVKVHSLPTSSFMAPRWHFCGVPFATNSGGQFFSVGNHRHPPEEAVNGVHSWRFARLSRECGPLLRHPIG